MSSRKVRYTSDRFVSYHQVRECSQAFAYKHFFYKAYKIKNAFCWEMGTAFGCHDFPREDDSSMKISSIFQCYF